MPEPYRPPNPSAPFPPVGFNSKRARQVKYIIPEDYYKRIPAPLEFFLYPQSRHTSLPSTVPEDLGERLREFVLPPPEVALAVEEALPESFTEIHHDHGPEDEGEEYQPAEPVHRDMERAAARDLSAVLRLVDLGRVAVSAKTRWPSAAAAKRISEELHGGDFFGPDDRDHDTGRGVGSGRSGPSPGRCSCRPAGWRKSTARSSP